MFELPAHNLPMDEPAPSQLIYHEGKTHYDWQLSATERAHIADMLGMDVNDIKITGSTFGEERSQCTGCGKHSGLDDVVHNALYAGIHSAQFMKDVITGAVENTTPYTEHEVTCSRCVTKHEGPRSWRALPPWTHE